MSTRPPIPTTADHLTADWLNRAFDGSVAEIVDVRAERLGEGVGLLGEVTRLHLRYRDGSEGPRPTTMIAKCQAVAPGNVFMSQAMGFYERESSFYSRFSRTINLRVPHCHYTDVDPSGAPYIVLIEEITDARMVDQVVGADLDDTAAILDQAVTLHSTFWDNDLLRSLSWLPPMNNPLYRAAREMAEPKLESFIATWSGILPERTLGWMRELTPKYPDMVDWWVDQGHATFVHMDFRADNFLFGGSAGAGTVTVLDWQLSARHVGLWDVANFLGQSVTIENRRSWEGELVRRYHDGLLAAGVTGYPWERCWRDYRYCLLHQAWSQVAVSDIDPGNDRGRRLLHEMITRAFAATDDNDGADLLGEF
ncbi:MAG: phosphotransferase family protein [Acidimicrobiia bacterium]